MLFKQTWPSLSSTCHRPWKGPRRSSLARLSLPATSKDARLSRTDTKMEWATRWQNRNRRLVSRIEPFYPQRKIRCLTGGEKNKKKEKTLTAKGPDWRDLQMRCSEILHVPQKPSDYQIIQKLILHLVWFWLKVKDDEDFAEQNMVKSKQKGQKNRIWRVISWTHRVKFARCFSKDTQVKMLCLQSASHQDTQARWFYVINSPSLQNVAIDIPEAYQ